MHKTLLAVFIILIILVLYFTRKEKFSVWQKSSDPLTTHYMGNNRDIAGMSQHDYFLETQRMRENKVLDVPEDGTSNFSNYTDYIEMPAEYRPAASNARLFLDKKYDKLEYNLAEGMCS